MFELPAKYGIFFLFLIISAFVGGLIHELGHYIVGWFLGWKPTLYFSRGGSVQYENAPSIEGAWSFISLLAGPIVTFGLALTSFKLWKSHPFQIFLALALWNAVFRLSVLIDGKGSDESKMSAIVGIPLVFQSISIIGSLFLAYQILQSQELIPKSIFLIPVYFVFCAIAYKVSFGMCSLIFR